jgi:hypothetical protein
VLAEPHGMRPLLANYHLGLVKLHHRMGNPGQAQEHLAIAAAMYREMDTTCWNRPWQKLVNSDRGGAPLPTLRSNPICGQTLLRCIDRPNHAVGTENW